jgi:NAD(P)-dependent dehydrogenase (short-subunit alcohol dehydrogenase family)
MSISHPAADKSGLYFCVITKLSVMKNKVILITGTNSGFGWLTATSCAALGHKVYATMRDTKGRNAEKAEALTRQANIEVLDVELTSDSVWNGEHAELIH